MIKEILPNFIKDFIKRKLWLIRYKVYEKKQQDYGQVPYVLFGIPIHGNIGDQAISIAENVLLKDIGVRKVFEVISPDIENITKALKNIINKKAIIIVHGGGFLGNQWIVEQKRVENVIKTFPNNKIVIFPQTVFFTDNNEGKLVEEKAKTVFSSHKNLVICAREKKSYSLMKELFKNAKIILIPDIVLYLDEFKNNNVRDGILLCLRSDPEAKLKKDDRKEIFDIASKYDKNIKWTDTVINEVILQDERQKYFNEKLEEFSKSKLVITDRLHGMIFAAMTKTPCIVMGNYNHKVKGVYEWMKDLQYVKYIDSLNDIENVIKLLYNLKVEKYNCLNKKLYEQLIKELK